MNAFPCHRLVREVLALARELYGIEASVAIETKPYEGPSTHWLARRRNARVRVYLKYPDVSYSSMWFWSYPFGVERRPPIERALLHVRRDLTSRVWSDRTWMRHMEVFTREGARELQYQTDVNTL